MTLLIRFDLQKGDLNPAVGDLQIQEEFEVLDIHDEST